MPDPTPATIGYWTAGTARLAKHGEAKFGDDQKPVSCSDVYKVYVTDTTARLALSSVSGLPAVGSAHATYTNLVLSGYRVTDHEPGEKFREIVCDYEDGVTESTGGQTPEEIGRVTALDYPAYTATGDLVSDQISGDTVLNSAGDLFDSVPQFEQIWTGVHFVRRVSAFPSAILALAGTVNSVSVTCYGVTFGKRTARLRVGCRYLFDGSKRPYELDITLEPRHTIIDPTNIRQAVSADYEAVGGNIDIGWDIALVDCGFLYLDGGRKVRFTVIDENGGESAPQLPQPLTKDGGDGRSASHKSLLIVRTATGDTWATLQIPQNAL